jgi:Protein of unknown function (DUF3168)
MIAETDIRGAILAALREAPALAGTINGVYDGAPSRGQVPYAVLGDISGSDWGTKDAPGREIILMLSLYDRHENTHRIGELARILSQTIASLPRDIAGWHIGSAVPLRSRLMRSGERSSAGPVGGQYLWQSEWRLRVLSANNI